MKSVAVVATLVLMVAGGLTYFGAGPGVSGSIQLSGVVAANEVIVAAKIEGRIQRLHVNEGSWVDRGALVAELDREELEAERQRQVAVVGQTSARLNQSREQLSLDQERLRSQITGAQAQLQLAQSQREEARAEIGQLQKDFKRTSELVRQGLVPPQEAEKVETSLRVAEARAKSLEDRVQVARAELEVSRANERQVRVTTQEVEQIRAQLEQAKAQLAQMEARVAYAQIKAPLSGIVSTRVARQGEVIRPGDPIVTIIDPDDVWVRAEVEESYMNRVVLGQILPVRLASGEQLQGKVIFVSPEAEFATQRDVNRVKRDIRTFGIKVALANRERRLHPGMSAHVLLPAGAPSPMELAASNVQREQVDDVRPRAQAPDLASAQPPPASVAPAPANPIVTETAPGDTAPPPEATAAHPVPDEAGASELGDTSDEPPVANAPAAALVAKRTQPALLVSRSPEPAPPVTKLAEPARQPDRPSEPARSSGPKLDSAAEKSMPRFSLEAIAMVAGKPVAVINHRRVRQGDLVSGARVIKILDNLVELEYQGRRFTVGL